MTLTSPNALVLQRRGEAMATPAVHKSTHKYTSVVVVFSVCTILIFLHFSFLFLSVYLFSSLFASICCCTFFFCGSESLPPAGYLDELTDILLRPYLHVTLLLTQLERLKSRIGCFKHADLRGNTGSKWTQPGIRPNKF